MVGMKFVYIVATNMKCPNGHEVNGQVKFCPTCGADLRGTKFCTNCGSERNGDEDICPHCGKPYLIHNETSAIIERSSSKKLIISLIIACVVLIGICGWALSRKESKVTASQTEQVTKQVNESFDDSSVDDSSVELMDSALAHKETITSEPNRQNYSYNDNSSSSSSYSTSSSNNSNYSSEPTSKMFANEQYVTMYLANQTFANYSGVDIRIDGSLRIYIDGDYAGVVSVLQYRSTYALIKYSGGAYGEGRIVVNIENGRLKLSDPVDGTTWYQK